MRSTNVNAVAAAALAFTLTGCASSASDAARPSDAPTAHRSESATPIAPDAPAPAVESGPCAEAVSSYPISDQTETEQLGGASLSVPFDRGAMPHAAGRVMLNGHGTPVAYRVASNDTISQISARLCLSETWLSWVNYVRRDGDALFAGDTLNLDAHTIFSVDSQNGSMHDNPLPEGFVIPPQR